MSDIPSIIPIPVLNENNGPEIFDNTEDVISCWLDCDPGHDDALAIILALNNSKINLVGISIIAGNQFVDKTTINALQTLNICGNISQNESLNCVDKDEVNLSDCLLYGGLNVPIVQGQSKPLLRPSRICDEIHGDTGLEGAHFPKIPQHALDYTNKIKNHSKHFTTLIYETLKASSSLVTLVATGPLTNIALLILNYPDVVKYVSKIVLMGGACGIGNTGAVAEFNIQVDPEAAHIVFESHIPIYMIPLEVTHTVLVTPQILKRIEALKTRFSQTIIQLLLYFKSTYKEVFGFTDPPLHDPTTIAFLINPHLFTYRLMRVDIEMRSELSFGQTVCDIYNMSNKRKNVHVCLKLNVEKFWDLMLEAISKANEKSPLNK